MCNGTTGHGDMLVVGPSRVKGESNDRSRLALRVTLKTNSDSVHVLLEQNLSAKPMGSPF